MKSIYAIVPLVILVIALTAVIVFVKPAKNQAAVPIKVESSPLITPELPPSITPTFTPTPTPDASVSRVYSGILPCADCQGLLTELTLTQPNTNAAEGTFTMKETYVGRSVDPLQTAGTWTTLRGTPADKNAVVYEIIPAQSDAVTYYLKTGDTTIKQLDKDQKEIKTKLNYTLTLVLPSLAPEVQKIIGLWRSDTDAKYTREFKADGSITDTYASTPNGITVGTWKTITDPASEPVQIPAVGGAIFIKVALGTETFYYGISSASTADHLTLAYVNGKGNLDFTRVK